MAWGARRSIATQVEARKEVAARAAGARRSSRPLLRLPATSSRARRSSRATARPATRAATTSSRPSTGAPRRPLDSYLAGGRKERAVVTQVTNGKNAARARSASPPLGRGDRRRRGVRHRPGERRQGDESGRSPPPVAAADADAVLL